MKNTINPLSTIEILRRSKRGFHDKLCKTSAVQDPLHLQKLRSENAFALAEFLYLLQSFNLLNAPDRFAIYVRNHNNQLHDLLTDLEKRRLMGLEEPRLKKGVFSERQIEKAIANLESNFGGLDQADMQRLTITLFSPETGRRMFEILEESGFLTRSRTPFQCIILKSNGFIETCYEEYLTNINHRFLEYIEP